MFTMVDEKSSGRAIIYPASLEAGLISDSLNVTHELAFRRCFLTFNPILIPFTGFQ